MFPLKDLNPTSHPPLATYAIIAGTVLVWLIVQGAGTEPALARSVCAYGAIPAELWGLVPPGAAVQLGAQPCPLGQGLSWLTALSSMVMHGGWFHLIGNLWFLYIFGDNVEDALGPLRFTLFYILCGLGAVVAQALANPASPVPMVGASGAIGGVMGAYAVLYPLAPIQLLVVLGFFVTRIAVPAVVMLGYWYLLQLLGALPSLGGALGGVAFWAHVGGFVSGALLVWPLLNRTRVARRAQDARRRREKKWP